MAHVIVLDSLNKDLFVCGLCKSVFNYLELFLDHKRNKCLPLNLGCILTNESVFPETSCNPGDNALTNILQAECTETETLPEAAMDELIYSETAMVCTPGENTLTKILQAESTETQHTSAMNEHIYSETALVCNSGKNTLTNILKAESIETPHTSVNELIYSETPLDSDPGEITLSTILQGESKSIINGQIFPLSSSVCNPGENSNEPLATSTGTPLKAAIDVPIYSETPLVSNSSDNALTSKPLANSTETPCDVAREELICTVCKKKFKLRKGLLAHTKSHYVKPYQCLVCGRCFFQNSQLKRHILSHKVWPESLSKTTPKCPEVELLSFSCPYCTMLFSNYNQFRAHLKNHQSFKKFKCIQGDCKDFYDTLEMLIHHVASFHITQLYVCHICKESFNSLESIANHIECGETSIQMKQYKCSQCEAVFTKPEKLYLHMLTENHQKVCIHCKKTFASDKRLRLHLQIHRGVKPFQCNICDSSFHMKKYLNSHMLIHGTKEFVCPVCEYKFNRSDLLQRHMRSHNPSEMFQCPYKDTLGCKREFSRKDKLQLHLRTHRSKLAEENLQETANDGNLVIDLSDHQVALNSNTD